MAMRTKPAEKQPAISDEQIVAALLANGTQRAAANALGIEEKTIYNRMTQSDFRAVYKAAKADLMRQAVYDMQKQLRAAVDTVAAIMQDEKNNPAIRLQAAQTILNNAGKFSDRLRDSENGIASELRGPFVGMW